MISTLHGETQTSPRHHSSFISNIAHENTPHFPAGKLFRYINASRIWQRRKPKLRHKSFFHFLLKKKIALKTFCKNRYHTKQGKTITTTFEDNILSTRGHFEHKTVRQYSGSVKIQELLPRIPDSVGGEITQRP